MTSDGLAVGRSGVAFARPAWLTGMVPLIAGCVALAALSLLLPSSPTYDPWAWIIWGREVVHLDLSTVGGPSWSRCRCCSPRRSRSSAMPRPNCGW
jgi:hypothetical protein